MIQHAVRHQVLLVGFGNWGSKFAAVLQSHPHCSLVGIVDRNSGCLDRAQAFYPNIARFGSLEEALSAAEYTSVIIATSEQSHAELVRRAFAANLHVLVTKPVARSSVEAKELLEEARQKNLQLMVDFTYLYSGAVEEIRAMIDREAFGEIFYYHSLRSNLGLLRAHSNVLWDLAAHDLAILLFLFQEVPKAVSGEAYRRVHPSMPDFGRVSLEFPNRCIAQIDVSWLSPIKTRQTIISGAKCMAVWDDLPQDGKLRVYDSGIDVQSTNSTQGWKAQYRVGLISTPKLNEGEPLAREVDHFFHCIESKMLPKTDGALAIQVIELLEQIERTFPCHSFQ